MQRLTRSDIASEELRKDFVQVVFNLGSQYDYFRPHEKNTMMSIEYAKLQYHVLMSSDFYERDGLVGLSRFELS